MRRRGIAGGSDLGDDLSTTHELARHYLCRARLDVHVLGGYGITFVVGIEAMLDDDVVRQQLSGVIGVLVVAITGNAAEREVTVIIELVLDLIDDSIGGR